jgi:hypothetical protein
MASHKSCDCDDLRYRAERAEAQVESYERERDERHQIAERERKERVRAMSPSNLLYSNDVDFDEAMRCVIAQCDSELKEDFTGDVGGRLCDSLVAMRAAARIALAEYRQAVVSAERRFFEHLASSPDTDRKSFGECGLADDYSPLAI